MIEQAHAWIENRRKEMLREQIADLVNGIGSYQIAGRSRELNEVAYRCEIHADRRQDSFKIMLNQINKGVLDNDGKVTLDTGAEFVYSDTYKRDVAQYTSHVTKDKAKKYIVVQPASHAYPVNILVKNKNALMSVVLKSIHYTPRRGDDVSRRAKFLCRVVEHYVLLPLGLVPELPRDLRNNIDHVADLLDLQSAVPEFMATSNSLEDVIKAARAVCDAFYKHKDFPALPQNNIADDPDESDDDEPASEHNNDSDEDISDMDDMDDDEDKQIQQPQIKQPQPQPQIQQPQPQIQQPQPQIQQPQPQPQQPQPQQPQPQQPQPQIQQPQPQIQQPQQPQPMMVVGSQAAAPAAAAGGVVFFDPLDYIDDKLADRRSRIDRAALADSSYMAQRRHKLHELLSSDEPAKGKLLRAIIREMRHRNLIVRIVS
jgi:hypothetical protein